MLKYFAHVCPIRCVNDFKYSWTTEKNQQLSVMSWVPVQYRNIHVRYAKSDEMLHIVRGEAEYNTQHRVRFGVAYMYIIPILYRDP